MPLPIHHCEKCGRKMVPCPARVDGEDTFVGHFPCVCSREAWLNSKGREYGESYEEYMASLPPVTEQEETKV